MKKLIIIIVFFVTGKFIMAQQNDRSLVNPQDTLPTSQDTSMKTYISMQGAQMIFVQNDKAGRMMKDMTMKNGTVVKTTGEVKTKDGHSFQLKEGDRVYMNGRIEGPSKTPM